MSNLKTAFSSCFKYDLLKKLTDVKIQKGSEDRFSRIQKAKPLFKEKLSGYLDTIIWE